MQQRFILLLTRVNRTHESRRAQVEAEIEQCKEELDSLDVTIERLRKRSTEQSKGPPDKLGE
jgi:hypothetical protein